MQGAAKKPDQNRDAEREGTQDVFHKLLQADESAIRDLRRL